MESENCKKTVEADGDTSGPMAKKAKSDTVVALRQDLKNEAWIIFSECIRFKEEHGSTKFEGVYTSREKAVKNARMVMSSLCGAFDKDGNFNENDESENWYPGLENYSNYSDKRFASPEGETLFKASIYKEVTYEVKMKKAILDGDVFNDEDKEDENKEELI